MTSLSFEQRQRLIARRLALFDSYEWQAHPNMRQLAKQDDYARRAESLLMLIFPSPQVNLLDPNLKD